MPLVIDLSNIKKWDEVRGHLRPFDLLSFRGSDKVSDTILKLEREHLGVAVFSHSGMVVTSELLPNHGLIEGKRYVLESTFSYSVPGMPNAPDVLEKKGAFGVQLRDLDEVLPIYLEDSKALVAWCPLINNPWCTEDKEKLVRTFTEFFKKYYGRCYDMSIEDLLGSLYPEMRPLRNLRDHFFNGLYSFLHGVGLEKNKAGPGGWQFCSELVANVYRTLGIIGEKFDPRDVVPMDFFGCDQDGLPCLVEPPIFLSCKK